MALSVSYSYTCSLSMIERIQVLDCDLVNFPINFHHFYEPLQLLISFDNLFFWIIVYCIANDIDWVVSYSSESGLIELIIGTFVMLEYPFPN